MTILQGALLGLIQGLGEFLPISSSGHLLLARILMGIESGSVQVQAAMKMLDILLHVGTLIPVVIVFWKEWIEMISHPIRNRTLFLLIIASLPTLAIYMLAKFLFPAVGGFSVFDSGWFLGVAFLITGVFLLICDRASARRTEGSQSGVRFLNAVVMGIFQGIGMMPGISRSGSTILGGVVSGLDKSKAARFSFMMSAPAILGSLLMEGKSAIDDGLLQYIELMPTLVGIVVAAVSGFMAIRWMLKLINRISLSWFSLYLALIGIAYLLLQLAGSPLVPAFSV